MTYRSARSTLFSASNKWDLISSSRFLDVDWPLIEREPFESEVRPRVLTMRSNFEARC